MVDDDEDEDEEDDVVLLLLGNRATGELKPRSLRVLPEGLDVVEEERKTRM